MRKKILATIIETLFLKASDVTEATLVAQIAKDSMDLIELVAVFSQTYHIDVNPQELSKITTVGQIIDYVMTHHKKTPSSKALDSSF